MTPENEQQIYASRQRRVEIATQIAQLSKESNDLLARELQIINQDVYERNQ